VTVAEDYRGRFLWYELITTDPRGAQAFYTRLLGWDAEAVEGGPIPYTMFSLHGQPLAGMMQLPDVARDSGAPPAWIPYMATPNVDAAVEQAGRLGAKTFAAPSDIAGIGRFAVLADPAGAPFAVYRPASPPPPEGPVRAGEFAWHELMSPVEAEASFNFYSALFGWEKMRSFDMGPTGLYQIYGRNGRELGGMFKATPDMPPPSWVLYVRVDDVKSKIEELKALGGKVMKDPMEVPGGDWIVQVMDPQGAMFALHTPARKA
jgi:uncharacterized protein